jgi:hypothetical protein
MIIEDERGMLDENFQYLSNGDPLEQEHDTNRIHRFLKAHRRIKNKVTYYQLQ